MYSLGYVPLGSKPSLQGHRKAAYGPELLLELALPLPTPMLPLPLSVPDKSPVLFWQL